MEMRREQNEAPEKWKFQGSGAASAPSPSGMRFRPWELFLAATDEQTRVL